MRNKLTKIQENVHNMYSTVGDDGPEQKEKGMEIGSD
jgi:hypothetical protein